MFSRRTERRSIAWQLILLFTVATSLLLACGLGVFYAIVVRHAFAEDNAVLADKVAALRADLHESGPNVFAEELKDRNAGEHTAYWIRMLDSQGRTYAETPGMDRSLPPEIFPSAPASAKAPAGRQKLASIVGGLKDYRRGSKLFSLVALTEESGSQRYTLQVAQDRSSDERVERNFAVLFIMVLSGSVLASALIATIVTKRGLRPLQEMTQSLARIGPTHLKERVTPGDWPGELKPLAIAFDDMLKRLDDSFTRLSQFSADLAHELRTPIANMMGEAQVALTRDRTAAEYREIIESTVGECERLSKIVDNLLFVARVDAAREPIARKRFDARAAVEKIAAFYQAIADEHHVAITCSGKGEIYADPRLRRRGPGPGSGEIDCRSSRRLGHHREQVWPRHNGQTDISASVAASHLGLGMRTWSHARNAYLVAKGQSDKALAAAEESRTDVARARGNCTRASGRIAKLSCVIASQATMMVAGSLHAPARMPSSSPIRDRWVCARARHCRE